MIEKLKKDQQKLVFTEGADPRILEAASRLKQEAILEPILLGNPKEIREASEKYGFFYRWHRNHRPSGLPGHGFHGCHNG